MKGIFPRTVFEAVSYLARGGDAVDMEGVRVWGVGGWGAKGDVS